MTLHVEEHARVVSVERLRPGDHAFASYADEEARWSTLGSFAQTGITKGERVLLFPDPALPRAEVLAHLAAYGPPVDGALESGQLVVLTMEQMWLPHTLSVERQVAGLHREIQRARRAGYPSVRSAIDMAWVPSFGADIERVLWRESAGCHYLFADSRYTELCAYDRARFTTDVLDRAAAGHPTALLERPGSLLAIGGERPGAGYGLRLVGDADLSTREQFADILRRVAASGAERVVMDLTELTFLDVHCARSVLRLAAAMESGRRVEIRCGGMHAHTFLLLGALNVPQLTLEGE
ncbi:MEDS domain-containing protein [Streptomyces sp. NPDC003077]|uniref:MEDS domain-containing protein n=1 Tax=Streptomyces sp. NPDC003077 TaxID=3154443 RepID=UPI0033B7B74C